ncbi:hypothetical protein EIP86_009741 [Pleurotus ostreatoroseus]|nr:hypothetical protein EIP86_009741 [Pleurotus ostreatoroseus]
MADSAYEYFLKEWLLTGKTEQRYLDMYLESTEAIINELLYVSPERKLLYVVDANRATVNPDNNLQHLSCFIAGLFALGAATIPDVDPRHAWAAEGLAHTCWITYADSVTGLGPERVHFPASGAKWVDEIASWEEQGRPGGAPPGVNDAVPVTDDAAKEYKASDARYLLRPETLESIYIMWRTTGDAKWRDRGWAIFEAIDEHTRTENAYASVLNVNVKPTRKDNDLPRLKYAYLLFTDDELVPLDKWVFNTEAHPLPIYQWSEWEKKQFNISVVTTFFACFLKYQIMPQTETWLRPAVAVSMLVYTAPIQRVVAATTLMAHPMIFECPASHVLSQFTLPLLTSRRPRAHYAHQPARLLRFSHSFVYIRRGLASVLSTNENDDAPPLLFRLNDFLRDSDDREALAELGIKVFRRIMPRCDWIFTALGNLLRWAIGQILALAFRLVLKIPPPLIVFLWWVNQPSKSLIGVSHSWMHEGLRHNIQTSINGNAWPVPIPIDTTLERVRIELLNKGAEYVWLDVLCLRQASSDPTSEAARAEEWELDVPTIGSEMRQNNITLGLTTKSPVIYDNDGKLLSKVDSQADAFVKRLKNVQALAKRTTDKDLNLFDALDIMRQRSAVNEVDRVAGLAYLLQPTFIPVYKTSQDAENAWSQLMKSMDSVHRAQVLFLYPGPGLRDTEDGTSWIPTWKHLMKGRNVVFPHADLSGLKPVIYIEYANAYRTHGYLLENCRVQGLQVRDQPGPTRRGTVSLTGLDMKTYKFSVVADHQYSIPEEPCVMVGNASLENWIVGRFLASGRLQKIAVLKIEFELEGPVYDQSDRKLQLLQRISQSEAFRKRYLGKWTDVDLV